MKLIKLLAAITGILAGISLFIIQKQKKDEENARLDEYLMQDAPAQTAPVNEASDADLAQDIAAWKNLPSQYLPVTISFGFRSEEDALKFQKLAAASGYSSDLDNENRIVDVIYNEDFSTPALSSLAENLAAALSDCNGEYQGFHFN